MEHIAALLLIVGCSGDLKQCSELPAPTSIYETFEECQTDLKPSLDAFKGSHPRIAGQCVYVDPAMEEEDAQLVWDIRPDGTLEAVIESAGSQVASAGVDRQEGVHQ